MRKKIRAVVLSIALVMGGGIVAAQPAYAWWGYAEGYVSAKSFNYVYCADGTGRTVATYRFRLGYGYPYDDGPRWVNVPSYDYWRYPVGSRWGGYPLSGFC